MKKKIQGPAPSNAGLGKVVAWKVCSKPKTSDLEKDALFNPNCVYNVGVPVGHTTVPQIKTGVTKNNRIFFQYPFTDYKGRCFYDHHDFEGEAVVCPISYNEHRRFYQGTGAFCSDNCALAWGETCGNLTVQKFCSFWLHMLRKRLKKTNQGNGRIVRAPHIYTLKAYGGPLTIEEFRNSFKNPQLVHTSNFPLVTILPTAWQLYSIDKE